MKKKSLPALLRLTQSIVGIAFVACSSQMGSEQYVNKSTGTNGSFEVDRNGFPANWLVYTSRTAGSGDFVITTDTTTSQDGKQSLKFDVKQCSNKGGRFSPGITQEYQADEGATYQISYWIRNDGAAYRICITGITATQFREGPTHKGSEKINEWTNFTHTYQIPKGMKKLRFELNVLTPGKFWIDNISITKQ